MAWLKKNSWIIIPLACLLHFLRGRGLLRFGKLIMSLSVGIAYGYFLSSLIAGGIVFLGIWLWLAPGVGKGFLVIHGKEDVYNEKEIPFLDESAEFIFPHHSTISERKFYGFIWMSLRGLFILPLFIAMAIFLHKPLIGLIGLFGLVQGLAYWLGGRISQEYGVMIAEIIMGLVVGTMLWGTTL